MNFIPRFFHYFRLAAGLSAFILTSVLLFGQGTVPPVAPVLARSIHWVSSTAEQPWQEMPAPAITQGQSDEPSTVKIDPLTPYQVIDGFGGCFNELGWDALQAVGPEQRAEALQALFSPSGCDFTNCRMGIGANDFARSWYSFDETPDDFTMAHFSIDRDKTVLIPYIKAAMAYSPKLEIWGVPWSPPSWMKTNNSYQNAFIKMDPKILNAYGLYFAKYVQAYRQEGINVYAIAPQNEPVTGGSGYPKCRWNGRDLKTFVTNYLVPQLKANHVDVQVWLGTINDAKINDFTIPFLSDPVTNPMITGVGYQYGGQKTFTETHARFPDKKMMQTETECYHGENTWNQGMNTFGHIASDMDHFANAYNFWNMILNQKHTSTWGWCQNSLVILDAKTQKVIYNPDFYAMKHYGHFVQVGAHRIEVKGGQLSSCIAFKNPAGDIVVAFGNTETTPQEITLQLGQSMAQLNVPAKSMNTAVLTDW